MMPQTQQAQQIHQLYDKFLKDMAERHPEEFVWLAFPNQRFELISTQLDKELIVRSRQVDTVMIIRTKRGRQLFHLEFKSRYDRKELRKIFGYAGGLTLKYRLDVTTILYLVKPPSRRAKDLGLYQAMPFEEPTNQFGFKVVRLWELVEAILAGDKRLTSLVPLLLELVAKPDISDLRRQHELIRSQKDPKRRAELYYYSLAFAKRHFADSLLRTLLQEDRKMDKEMYEYWKSVPIVGDIIGDIIKKNIEEKTREVRQEVRQEVQAQALREDIMTALEAHFGQVNGKIARMVNSIDNPQKLKIIFKRALKAESLDTVVNMLQKAKLASRRKTAKA